MTVVIWDGSLSSFPQGGKYRRIIGLPEEAGELALRLGEREIAGARNPQPVSKMS
jgi:hypothetical protein